MSRKPAAIALTVALVAVVGVVVLVNSLSDSIKIPQLGPACVVRADGEVSLDLVQMANAATIAAVGVRKQMPERAIVVALATAFQESKLENISHGDRDSLGLFQQRPSQGWGRPEQIQDPRYAAGKFYNSLKRVKGWKDMRVTDAAQKVQKSAYPNAYEKWADESAVLARALTGRATGAVACTVTGAPVMRGPDATSALAKGMRLDWGKGVGATVDRTAGLRLTVKDAGTGWRYAHWLVAHAREHGLERVRFSDLEWHAPTGQWRPVTDGQPAGIGQVVAEVFR